MGPKERVELAERLGLVQILMDEHRTELRLWQERAIRAEKEVDRLDREVARLRTRSERAQKQETKR